MKTNSRLITLFAVTASLSASALAQSLQITFSPNKPRYARGETLTIVYTARDAAGNRVASAPLLAWRDITSTGSTYFYPTMFTDANGQVRISYTIPTDPNKDNIYFNGTAIVNGTETNHPRVRIPIGT